MTRSIVWVYFVCFVNIYDDNFDVDIWNIEYYIKEMVYDFMLFMGNGVELQPLYIIL